MGRNVPRRNSKLTSTITTHFFCFALPFIVHTKTSSAAVNIPKSKPLTVHVHKLDNQRFLSRNKKKNKKSTRPYSEYTNAHKELKKKKKD